MIQEPPYFGTQTGLVLKALIIDKQKNWRGIQDKTNLEAIEILSSLKELLCNGHLTLTREDCYSIDQELANAYLEYFNVKRNIKPSESDEFKRERDFTLGFMIGISLNVDTMIRTLDLQELDDTAKHLQEPLHDFVSSQNSDVYHRSDCYWVGQIKNANKRFLSEEETRRLRPCKKCRPDIKPNDNRPN